MTFSANFQVDPRLAALLGENYRSLEKALKELIDNTWDANAETVSISLPDLWEKGPIVIHDDGTGMTEKEVRSDYLAIASPRASRKGKYTPLKNRRVKGRKGIGKFAGLVMAGEMKIETRRNGQFTTLEISKQAILEAQGDLEQVTLPLVSLSCAPEEHGSTITLSQLNTRFNLPSAEKLEEILVCEYGREQDFTIFLNGKRLTSHALPGETFTPETDIEDAGHIRMSFTIMNEPAGARKAGVVTRVAGKTVGAPSFFGLENNSALPRRFLNRIVGEIEADGLEQDVTADWDTFLEGSKACLRLQEFAAQELLKAAEGVLNREVKASRTRVEHKSAARLETLPLHQRPNAKHALDTLLRRFHGEPENRLDAMVNLALDLVENDPAATACQALRLPGSDNVKALSDALREYGDFENSAQLSQIATRKTFLDRFEQLIQSPRTETGHLRATLERNLWLLGPEYSLLVANHTSEMLLNRYADKRFGRTRSGAGTTSLILATDETGYHLLIDCQPPTSKLTNAARDQVARYQTDLSTRLGPVEAILLTGGRPTEPGDNSEDSDLTCLTYAGLVKQARQRFAWSERELAAQQTQ